MEPNPIAKELNQIIHQGNPNLLSMLSKVGKRLFFPKGILSQSAEAKAHALPEFNATIGIATENAGTMYLPKVMDCINSQMILPQESLTYASSFGIPELRQVWKDGLYRKNPSLQGKTISLPVVTNGITHGISVFGDMFVDPDDVVIFPDKMWGNNNLILGVRRDARISTYNMFTPEGGFDTASFAACVKEESVYRDKIIVVLNFPNNPTGYTINDHEADEIISVLKQTAQKGTKVIAVMDDAYFGLRYEESPIQESIFARMCDLDPGLLSVKLDGATKEMFVWGLRVGFITYNTLIKGESLPVYDALERKTAGNIRGMISNCSHLGQTMVLKTLASPEYEAEREEKVNILKKRANRVKEVVTDPRYRDAWEMYPFNSGYFMCIRLKTVDAEELRKHLLTDVHRVGLISIGKTDLRVAFSCVDENNIPLLFDEIYQGVRELEKQ